MKDSGGKKSSRKTDAFLAINHSVCLNINETVNTVLPGTKHTGASVHGAEREVELGLKTY